MNLDDRTRHRSRVRARCRNCHTSTLTQLGDFINSCPGCGNAIMELEAVEIRAEHKTFRGQREGYGAQMDAQAKIRLEKQNHDVFWLVETDDGKNWSDIDPESASSWSMDQAERLAQTVSTDTRQGTVAVIPVKILDTWG